MTYKVADVLQNNGYILPLERKEGLSIPRVEIKNYTPDKKLSNAMGDIDIVFYSGLTRTLYLIEYKNYQMMVSKQGDLSSEISKVSRENTVEKVLNRQEYIKSNVNIVFRKFFTLNDEVESVKSIILSTKPNFYFYAT